MSCCLDRRLPPVIIILSVLVVSWKQLPISSAFSPSPRSNVAGRQSHYYFHVRENLQAARLSRRAGASRRPQAPNFITASQLILASSRPNAPAISEDQVALIRAEADRIRKEADLLERDVTQNKISIINRKLSNQNWVEKNRSQKDKLERDLCILQQKLSSCGSKTAAASAEKSITVAASDHVNVREPLQKNTKEQSALLSSLESEINLTTKKQATWNSQIPKPKTVEKPLRGFEDSDLNLYVPVAKRIESNGTFTTTREKIEAFQNDPELQSHFQEKIVQMITKPLQDVKELATLKSAYLTSSSKVEKKNLKRQIETLQKSLRKEGAFSEQVFLNIAPMTEEELQVRVQALLELPHLLQVLYKQKIGLDDENAEISLAILADHYQEQLFILEQIGVDDSDDDDPLDDEERQDTVQALESLPIAVRDYFARQYGLEDGSGIDLILDKLLERERKKNNTFNFVPGVVVSALGSGKEGELEDDLYDDIEFMDRSSYVEEFYPGLARLEEVCPDDIDLFVEKVVDPKCFMMNCKPERVVGGFYIRGDNLLKDDESGTKLVQHLSQRLTMSGLDEKFEFFYIVDPEPLSEEDIELENESDKLLFVSVKNHNLMTNHVGFPGKLGVNVLGLSSIALFSVLAAQGNALTAESLATTTTMAALSKGIPIATSLLAVQLAHECGHWMGANNNVTLGFPSLVPYPSLGILGTITPLQSPPPNFKALFDFAISGPLVGFLASFLFLLLGLLETGATDFAMADQSLPRVPIELLRSSALGGGLIEAVLGTGTLMGGAEVLPEATLPLHPAAIAGFVGLITNAFSLLPLGNTDGGRVALAMLGARDDAFLFSTATSVVILMLGLLNQPLLAGYAIFAMLWQRELELPARNEVEQLDWGRGCVGIVAAALVLLTIVPMV